MCKECDKRFNEDTLVGKLRGIDRRLLFSNGNSEAVSDEVEILEKVLLGESYSSKEEADVVSVMNQGRMMEKFQAAYSGYEVGLETEFAADIIAGEKSDVTRYRLFPRFKGLISDEIRLASICQDDRVLFVGSGPFPISSILLAQELGCSVDCYDSNLTAVYTSREVVDVLGLGNKIKIEHKDGCSLPDKKYDVAIVDILANPKEGILESVMRGLGDSGRVLCRTTEGIRQAFYKSSCDAMRSGYVAKGMCNAKGYSTISSIRLE